MSLACHRNALAHGDGLITVDRKGQWMLRLTFYDKDALTQIFHFEPEAEALRDEIRLANEELRSLFEPKSQTPDPTDTPSA
jgi:hypothetical protein